MKTRGKETRLKDTKEKQSYVTREACWDSDLSKSATKKKFF